MMVARVRLYCSLIISILLVCVALHPLVPAGKAIRLNEPLFFRATSTTYPMPPLNGKICFELGWELSDDT